MDTTTTQTPKAAALARLAHFDFLVCIDASGSMGEPVTKGGTQSRWDSVQETALAFSRDIATIDDDGIGVVMFSGHTITSKDNCNVDAVRAIFADRTPRAGTPLAEALTEALKLSAGSDKKKIIIVFTDGIPDGGHGGAGELAAAKVITDQANKQESDDELTFVFIQVGDDADATAYLKRLDDGLNTKFDIVAAYTVDEANEFPSTAELLVHAIDN